MEAIVRTYGVLDESVERWAAIRTAARWEKKAAETLARFCIPVFLPSFRRVTKYKTRTATCDIPLFSGYLFFDETRLDQVNDLSPAHKKYIAQVLRTNDHRTLGVELRQLSKAMSDYELIQSKLYGRIGDTVRIRSGVFAQYDGRIVRYGATHNRLVLAVSYLGLFVEIEIDDRSVEKLN
ncbi:MAG TPA: transcription termination/antitermination NusG family protein [Planctomycetota bacterium]|nr:transcription termination/antitermination NusG family protein [Planctomycetota bacterium]